jgi:CO/xanthine dehydrogenase FAD-binding subunit
LALRWVDAALVAVEAAPADEQASLALGGCAPHQLLTRKAELQLAVGEPAAASETYEAASEAALEAGKTKVAMRLQALAAECAPDE